jgi:uncharacterized membrane protein
MKKKSANVITFGGFLCVILSALITIIYSPTLTETNPNYIFILNGILIFVCFFFLSLTITLLYLIIFYYYLTNKGISNT